MNALKAIAAITLQGNLPPSTQRPAMHPSIVALLPKIKRQRDLARHWFGVRFRDPEQGGYVHDTATSVWIPVSLAQPVGGTWTHTVGSTALTYMLRKTGAGATTQLVIPIAPLQNSVALKGSLIKSIDLYYKIATATLTTLTHLITKDVPAADTVAWPAVTAPAFTYDALNTSNALRVAQGQRVCTLTITTPIWIANTDVLYVDITIVDPGTTVFDWYGARANYTLRM